jgi:DNA-binding LytR/AlgR family response regulator
MRRDGGPLKQPHTGRTPLSPCGTQGGYVRHVKAREVPCAECREAQRRYMAQYRQRRPDVRQKDIDQLRARTKATRLLIERHRDEFRALLSEVSA